MQNSIWHDEDLAGDDDDGFSPNLWYTSTNSLLARPGKSKVETTMSNGSLYGWGRLNRRG